MKKYSEEKRKYKIKILRKKLRELKKIKLRWSLVDILRGITVFATKLTIIVLGFQRDSYQKIYEITYEPEYLMRIGFAEESIRFYLETIGE